MLVKEEVQSDDVASAVWGFDEAPAPLPRIGGVPPGARARVDDAYQMSPILGRFEEELRPRWSILREQRLADIAGSWMRGDAVFRVDLPSILHVDEWLECETRLSTGGDADADELTDAVGWIETSLVDHPADTIFGVICKLLIWRRKNAAMLDQDSAGAAAHRLAVAAYGDLLRLTGLLSLATPADRETGVV